jgi:hypothetical protein
MSVLSLTACGGLSPGDYIVYRIALQPAEQSADCFAAGAVPVNEQDDSSSLFTAATYVLYMGADEVPYLDTGSEVLGGSGDGDAYSFSGESVDVNFPMPEQRETTSLSIEIDLEVDGEVVDGVRVDAQSFECSGPACPDPPDQSCTTTRPFTGGEVADVDLKHEV